MKNYISAILLCLSFEVLAQGTSNTTYQYFSEFPWGLMGSTTLNGNTVTQTQYNRQGAFYNVVSYPNNSNYFNPIGNLNNNVEAQNEGTDAKGNPMLQTTVFQTIGTLQIPFAINVSQIVDGGLQTIMSNVATVNGATISTISQHLGLHFNKQVPQTYVLTNNSQGNITGVQFSEKGVTQANYSFKYGSNGQPTQQTETLPPGSNQNPITTTFNELGQPFQVTQGENTTILTYNSQNGNVNTINTKDPSGTVSYVNTYDNNNFLVSTQIIQKDTSGNVTLHNVVDNTFNGNGVLTGIKTSNYDVNPPYALLNYSLREGPSWVITKYNANGELTPPSVPAGVPVTDKFRVTSESSKAESFMQTQ